MTPILLLVALVALLGLREVWRLAPAGTARGRVGRVGSVVVAVIAFAVVARLLVAPLPSDRTLTWQSGSVLNAADAANAVRIEVERPACAPDGTSWIAPPIVTYTPLAVFITVRMADTFTVPGCTGVLGYHGAGRLPTVGGYLMGTFLDVYLTEPLGGRALFDGSGLLPEPRLRL